MQPYRCLRRRWGFAHRSSHGGDFESPPWNGSIVLRDDERDGFWTADISLPEGSILVPFHRGWRVASRSHSTPPPSSTSSGRQTASRSIRVLSHPFVSPMLSAQTKRHLSAVSIPVSMHPPRLVSVMMEVAATRMATAPNQNQSLIALQPTRVQAARSAAMASVGRSASMTPTAPEMTSVSTSSV